MIIEKYPVDFNIWQTVVDIEICNDISNPKGGDWFYDKSDICTVGILQNKEIVIIQREKSDKKDDFINYIKNIIPKRFYAFNWRMEKMGLKGFCNIDYNVDEIKPFMGKGWSKDKFFLELMKLIRPVNICDPLNGDASLIKSRYENEMYTDIILHNLNCLIKEGYIIKFRPLIKKTFASKINKDGWYDDTK